MPIAPPRLQSLKPKVATLAIGAPRYDRQAKRAQHTWSKAWRTQRARVLLRDNYLCHKCGRYGDQVDHINGNAERLVKDHELQTLCATCHSAKTSKENHGFGNASQDR